MAIPETDRLRALLLQAQQALSTCTQHYSEFNQFEGEWYQQFSESQVHAALVALNAELGLPAPAQKSAG